MCKNILCEFQGFSSVDKKMLRQTEINIFIFYEKKLAILTITFPIAPGFVNTKTDNS